MKLWLLAPVLLLPAAACCGEFPPPGGQLIGAADFAAYASAPQQGPYGSVKRVAVADAEFAYAAEATIANSPRNPWDVQVLADTTAPIRRNDTLFVTLMARVITSDDEAGDGRVTVFFQINRPPHTKEFYNDARTGRRWSRICFPFTAGRDYAAGEAAFGVMLGHQKQRLQIAEMQLHNFGPGAKINELPVTATTYAGQEPDAPWRRAAAERIDRYRKADLAVVVNDRAGRPLEASVHLSMQRHAFHFGSAVDARLIMDPGADGDKYRAVIENLCTIAVFENDLKWQGWENTEHRKTTMQALDWLEQRQIAVRGHCLVWPSWENTPADLRGLKDNPEALRKRVADHIRDEAGALRGRIYEWDVINEPYSNHDLMDVLGRDVMIAWFKLAHASDPAARLFLNDYSILSAGGSDHRHQNHFEETIRFLQQGGAPISGIGMQSHFGTDVTPPERVYAILERYAALGLPIAITEHDINTLQEKLHCDYTRDFMTIVFSHPRVESILSWGFWAGRHWQPDGAYYDREWNLRPAGRVWRDLLTREWRTDETLRADREGRVATRGFLGDYRITVTRDNQTAEKTVRLTREGATVVVTL